MAETKSIDVLDAAGKKAGTAELPAAIFDVPTNVALIHQVVTAQLAAARRAPATHARARSALRSSPAVASSTVRFRATTRSAPPRR